MFRDELQSSGFLTCPPAATNNKNVGFICFTGKIRKHKHPHTQETVTTLSLPMWIILDHNDNTVPTKPICISSVSVAMTISTEVQLLFREDTVVKAGSARGH